MLAADKLLLQANIKQNAVQLKEKALFECVEEAEEEYDVLMGIEDDD